MCSLLFSGAQVPRWLLLQCDISFCVLPRSPGCSRTHFVVQANLKLPVLLLQTSKCWNYRSAQHVWQKNKTKTNTLFIRKKGVLAMVVQFREKDHLQVFSLFGFLSVPPDFEETHKGAGNVTFSKFHGLFNHSHEVVCACILACVSILPVV